MTSRDQNMSHKRNDCPRICVDMPSPLYLLIALGHLQARFLFRTSMGPALQRLDDLILVNKCIPIMCLVCGTNNLEVSDTVDNWLFVFTFSNRKQRIIKHCDFN